MKFHSTPKIARYYLLAAALMIAFPSCMSLYSGHKGKFLVAAARTDADPNFKKTVIYLFHHNGWSAQGFVINRPLSPEKAERMLTELPEGTVLYAGGPVSPFKKYVISEKEKEINRAMKFPMSVMPLETFKEKKPEIWQDLLAGNNAHNVRIYLGYAGWDVLQLDREIASGTWAVLDYDRTLMHETPHDEIWEKATDTILKASGSYQPSD